MPHDPCTDDVFALSRLGKRGQDVVDMIACRPALASDPDAAIARHIRSRVPDVVAVFERLVAWGWVEELPGGERRLCVDAGLLRSLSARLRGMVEAGHLLRRSDTTPIVTLPETSEALRDALDGDAGACFETRDGFAHVAACAASRIVFLVPFMDAVGADTVGRILENCRASRRIVVCRPDSRGARHYARFASRLAEAGVETREYWRPRDGRKGPTAETFHAKMVMADKSLVYVGSSNLMSSSLDGGLECGVLLKGAQARPFRRIMEAVLSISTPLVFERDRHPPTPNGGVSPA